MKRRGSINYDDDVDVGIAKRKKSEFVFGESQVTDHHLSLSHHHLGSGESFWIQQLDFGVVNFPQVPFSITCP